MSLMELIQALQQNKEQSSILMETLGQLNKERQWLMDRLDEVRTRGYNNRRDS